MLAHSIPLVAIEYPIPNGIFLGVDNDRAGHLMAKQLTRWVKEHWHGDLDLLLVITDQRRVSGQRDRLKVAAETVTSTLCLPPGTALYLDARSSRQIAYRRTLEILARTGQTRIGVLCNSDDTAIGVLNAARALNREQHVAIVGQNATAALPEFRTNPDTRLIGTIDFQPRLYGEFLIELLRKIVYRHPYSHRNLIEPLPIYLADYHSSVRQ